MKKVKSYLKKTSENIFFGVLGIVVVIMRPWYKKALREAEEAERNRYDF